MSDETEEAPPEQTLRRSEPGPPEEEEKEEPVFSLDSLLKDRKKGGKPMEMGDVMAYAILTDIMDRREDRREERLWKRERREGQQTNSASKSPEVESIKSELGELRKTVTALADIIKTKEQSEAQKTFLQEVGNQVSDQIMPELQAVSQRLEALEGQATSTPQPTAETAELREIRDSLKSVTDKLGEKIGAKGLSLNDVTDLIDVIETLEKRLVKKGEGSEVDFKTMAVSTIGEMGKELITAYKEISTATKAEGAGAQPQETTPASAMQSIIKRQVQNYIVQRMEAGATTINVANAAQELALTPGQVAWAYNQLMKEGWFHVRTPSKMKGKVKQPVQGPQTGEETETEGASEESDQVFEPPPE